MLDVQDLTKDFGSFRAVNGVRFSVASGEVFGLMGENGAGKTTTLRLLATMLQPTSGTALVNGADILASPEEARGRIGILFGGESGLYDRLSGRENIMYFADLNDVPRSTAKERLEKLIPAFGIAEYIDRPAGKLSKGNAQKMAFLRAIIHDPAVMLLDEPSSGMDVTSIAELHRFILGCRSEGKAIVLSSHTVSEVIKLCDRVGVLHKGRLVDCGTIRELCDRHGCTDLESVFAVLTGGAAS